MVNPLFLHPFCWFNPHLKVPQYLQLPYHCGILWRWSHLTSHHFRITFMWKVHWSPPDFALKTAPWSSAEVHRLARFGAGVDETLQVGRSFRDLKTWIISIFEEHDTCRYTWYVYIYTQYICSKTLRCSKYMSIYILRLCSCSFPWDLYIQHVSTVYWVLVNMHFLGI